ARRHDAARHALLIKDTRVRRAGFHVRLVSAHDPVRRVQDLAAILNAGIAKTLCIVRGQLERATQLKIADLAVCPDQERVAFGGVFLRGLAGNRAVLHRPESLVTSPASEISAVENGLEVLFVSSG